MFKLVDVDVASIVEKDTDVDVASIAEKDTDVDVALIAEKDTDIDIASIFERTLMSILLRLPKSSINCKVTGNKVNRGEGNGLEIPCEFSAGGDRLWTG